MQHVLSFERRDIARWLLAVLCVSWLIGATSHVVASRQAHVPIDGNSYMPYKRQLAACNELRTSQAKYDCTSDLMVGRDLALFHDVLLVVLPPLALLGIVNGMVYMVRLRRQRESERVAREAYNAQMATYRAKREAEEAEIASGVHKEELFLDDDGNLVEAPAHFQRWKEEAEAK